MSVVSAPAVFVKASATGSVGVGPVSIPGLQVGDVVMRSIPDGFTDATIFEEVVTVADQLQQASFADLSSQVFTWYLLRGV
jgi:hypothetical protein